MTTIVLAPPNTEVDEDTILLQQHNDPDIAWDGSISETFLLTGPIPQLAPDLLDHAVPARGYGLCE
jgi:hypothetical protein